MLRKILKIKIYYHSKNKILIYYHKKYYKKCMKFGLFTITSKREDISWENNKNKRVLKTQKNKQQAQRNKSTTASEDEHELPQKL
jgi:hypothetical protein